MFLRMVNFALLITITACVASPISISSWVSSYEQWLSPSTWSEAAVGFIQPRIEVATKSILSQATGSADDEESPPGWYDPNEGGGRMLDYTTIWYGEPLNVIISGHSDPNVLTHEGLQNYAKSIGFSNECLGLHMGDLHSADLGDGLGRRLEQFLARERYFPVWGTCWESIVGGNHFRAWKQNGTGIGDGMGDGDRPASGAWFLAVSKEQYVGDNHHIVPDGYNIGRDFLVERALKGGKWKGTAWRAEVEWSEDLLEAGKDGVNHGIEQDGRVAILTVKET